MTLAVGEAVHTPPPALPKAAYVHYDIEKGILILDGGGMQLVHRK